MKIRIVEHRVSKKQLRAHPATSYEPAGPLDDYDPHVSEGWVEVSYDPIPLSVRSRMFYDVEEVSETSVSQQYQDDRVPGRAFEIHFDSGESLTVYNTIVAESEAEVVAAG